ncbi:MAG: hypothetical protein C4519_22375 [Desulfobacteraceae bacterium]|nr:MAG: hypothetical protein C4519_22375 [Desulfobacteraceae bacterium]
MVLGLTMPFYQIIYSLPPFLTAALLAVMAFTALGRGRRTPASRLLVLLCLLGSLLYVDILVNFNAPSASVALATSRIAHLFYPFLLPLFIQFFHAYLGMRRRLLERLAYGYAVLISFCAAGGWIISDVRRFAFGYFGQGGPLFFLLAGGAVFVAVYNGIIIYQAVLWEDRSIQKNRLKYVFFGFGLLGALSSLNCLTAFGIPIYPPGAFGFFPLLVFAAGVFLYDLLDMGALLRKSLLYSVLTTLLMAAYLLLIFPVQKLFKAFELTESPLFPLALLVLTALGYGPLKQRSQEIIERFLAKDRYDFRRTLRHVSQTIATVLDKEKLTRLLREIIIEAMKVKSCALFLVDPADGHYYAVATAGAIGTQTTLTADTLSVRHLMKSENALMKQHLLGAAGDKHADALLGELARMEGEVVLPMRFKQELKGFLVLGEKCSGRMYDSEDLDLLEPLCCQSAVAIQNAHDYQALKALNRTLERKVAARTRDLQVALAEKERSQEQLIRSESLAALGQLVAGVAHELNNPLTSVTSLLQSAVEDLQQWDGGRPVDETLLEDLRFADKELARARAIVASLLGLSRQTQTYEEAVHLNSVVSDTLRVLYNQYKHRSFNIIEQLTDDLPALRGNFANLGQVVLNIVQNAVQAVDVRGGRIILSTRYDAGARQVVFSCHDNGPGIDPVLQRDVFKPFFTTKPVGQGTGLGLYICHQIVEKHQGTIELASTEPHGTIVTVRLPTGM